MHAGVVQAKDGHSAGVVPELGRAAQPELPGNGARRVPAASC
jgi:hypothetical protein